jgi:serine/threonine protein kinase
MTTLKDLVLKNQYFLRDLVGSGGMADVYLAWDKLRSTKMAVKILRHDLAMSGKFFRAFEKEASRLEDLQHPYIVRLYEFDRDKEIVFIVMAWVDGVDLKKHITAMNRPLSLAEISRVLQPICSALHFAHQKNTYHCDIKPSNILLHENKNDVFLADFGVARVAHEQAGGGTLPYMAPEQFSHGEVGAYTDIYALGITVYEMLSGGVLPYRGETSSPGTTTRDRFAYEHSYLPMPPLGNFNASLPSNVVSVVQRALNKNPGDRFQTALEFLNAFERARSDTRPSVNDFPTTFEPPSTPIKQVRTPVVDVAPATAQSKLTTKMPQESMSAPPGKGVPYLFGRSGEHAGHTLPLLSRLGTSIGRGTNCHVRLLERSVSRMHATILVTKKGSYIRDEGSALGTFVNGKRIPVKIPISIKPGDVIQIGYFQVFEYRRG